MATVRKTVPSDSPKRPLKKVVSDELREFTLSTTVIQPSDSLQDYSTLLFGEKKIGKTKLASLFPDAYFIKAEAGQRGIVHRGDTVDSWKKYRKMLRLLRKDKSRTVIVDTVDMLYGHCDEFVCSDLGVDDIAEAKWGRGWRAVRDEFTDGMQELMDLNKGVLLISHATEKEIESRKGGKIDRVQPTMANTARDICEAMVDIWAYFHYNGDDRILTIRGDEHISAGHRLDTRFRWDGKEVRDIYMGTSAEEGLANFKACFNNKYKPRPEDANHEVEDDETDDAPPKKKFVVKRKKR